jgi:hypothetical protein
MNILRTLLNSASQRGALERGTWKQVSRARSAAPLTDPSGQSQSNAHDGWVPSPPFEARAGERGSFWTNAFSAFGIWWLLCLCASAADAPAAAAPDAAKTNSIWTGVATNAQGAVLARVTSDTSQTPELADWGRRAGELCAQWYPKIVLLLPSEGFTPPEKVELRFIRDMRGVAATSRDVIRISGNYVNGHKNDFGMVIHELTHVVQSYHRRGNPGWLVEGVADYIRLTHFEPHARRPRIDPDKASYRDAYKTTAIFLEWAEKKCDHALVGTLNSAMRDGTFDLDLFKTRTGKTVDELWQEFADSLRPQREASR